MARRGTVFRVYFYDGRWQSKQYTDEHHGSRKFDKHADALTWAAQWMRRYEPVRGSERDASVSITETDSHGYTTNHEAWDGSSGRWVKFRDATPKPKVERATKASLRKSAKSGGAKGPAKIRVVYQIGKRVV